MDEHDDEQSRREADLRPPAAAAGSGEASPGAGASEEPGRRGFTVSDRRFWVNREGGDGPAEEQPKLPTYVAQLKQQLEDKDRQLREYIAAYKHEVVEGLEKTKQRLERDAAREKERERGELARPMIEVLDALERSVAAVEAGGEAAEVRGIVQGLRGVHLLMVQKLQEIGLTRIETGGRPFDPLLHEAAAVLPVSDPGLDRMITAELRPGFLLGQRVVRPALVQVGRLQA